MVSHELLSQQLHQSTAKKCLLVKPPLSSSCTQKHIGKMLIFPQSNYQTRERRGETGKRAILQSQGWSHYCPGAAVVHRQVSCVTKMDFPSHFPWFNTLQSWSHIVVFSGIVSLNDIFASALSGAQTSLHIAPTPISGCKVGECL